MKLMNLLIIASVVALATAAVVKAPVKQKAKTPVPEKRQEDEEGVDVDPVITVSNIEVVEITAAPPTTVVALTSSSEENNSVSSASEELETDAPVNVDDAPPLNRYCKCSSYECKCCRDFSLPLVPISGPGCATIRYLENDRMSVGIKFGNRVLASRVISARQETPICLPLPGGFSNFCGRIYGIGREKDDFKACLGLELRADDELEAALRVSCFKFGERGLRVTEAEPLPVPSTNADEDDDDEDDLFGFGGDDDEDDDDPLGFSDATEDDTDDDDDDDETPASSSSADDDGDVDYTGFSLLTGDLLEDFLEDDDETPDKPAPIANRKVVKNKNKKNKGTLKKPQEVIESAVPAQNEVDSTLTNDKLPVASDETEITAENPQTSVEDDDDDEEEEEEDEDGILSLVSAFLSDDDEEEDDEDDEEEEEIETENTLNAGEEEATKDEVNEDDDEDEEDDLDDAADEVSAEAVADEIADDDDDEDEYDDTTESYKEQKKPSSSFSILGLRNFLSKLRS